MLDPDSHVGMAYSIVALFGDADNRPPADATAALAAALDQVYEIDIDVVQDFDGGPPGTIGFGVMKFKERKFYSIKMGNWQRDTLGSATLGGATLGGIAAGLKTGLLLAWPGLGAVAVGAIAVGRLKPLMVSFGFDDATALALAWDHSAQENGFQIAHISKIIAHLDEARTVYANHGFTEAKLRNAIGALKAIGLAGEAGGDQIQLTESVRIKNGPNVKLYRA